MAKQGIGTGLTTETSMTLSPYQIQMVRMLENDTLEFEERVELELCENEALERETKSSSKETISEDNGDSPEDEGIFHDDNDGGSDNHDYGPGDDGDNGGESEDYYEAGSYKENANNHSADDETTSRVITDSASLYDVLKEQIRLKNVSKNIEDLALYAIGNIDHEGYLRLEVEKMVDDLAFSEGKSVKDEDMQEAVTLIQSLDPAGIGAFNLQECLLLQLERKEQTKLVQIAHRMLDENLEDFSKKHFEKLIKKYNITEQEMIDIQKLIKSLNPKPGAAFDSSFGSSSPQIVPDFRVTNEDGVLTVLINDRNAPELRISEDTQAQLEVAKKGEDKESKDYAEYIKNKVEMAKWFINCIKQRQETLRKTMRAIVEKQKKFFLSGDETDLVPLALKDIANVTNYDISTISRVSSSKYVITDYGIYPLKFFFSESVATDDGVDVSNREIKKILQECIEGEDKKKPLTDERLKEILREKGYVIARRTVAKYREQLKIPVASQRKEI